MEKFEFNDISFSEDTRILYEGHHVNGMNISPEAFPFSSPALLTWEILTMLNIHTTRRAILTYEPEIQTGKLWQMSSPISSRDRIL
ncbi:MAG: hypothetical protein V8R85_06740 [Frisingicoccus sp.]